MNTINQTIPTAFSPETSFAIALSETSDHAERTNETFASFRFRLPPEDEFIRRGIPESALHD